MAAADSNLKRKLEEEALRELELLAGTSGSASASSATKGASVAPPNKVARTGGIDTSSSSSTSDNNNTIVKKPVTVAKTIASAPVRYNQLSFKTLDKTAFEKAYTAPPIQLGEKLPAPQGISYQDALKGIDRSSNNQPKYVFPQYAPSKSSAPASSIAGAPGSSLDGSGVPTTVGGFAANAQSTIGLPGKYFRKAAGESWEDPTLAEWNPNDYRIFVGDLGNDVNDDQLRKAFSKYPSFLKARVVRDKRSGKTKGYGFVSFSNPQDYAQAMREMNGKYIGNRPCKLRKSAWQDRNDSPPPAEVLKKKDKKNKKK